MSAERRPSLDPQWPLRSTGCAGLIPPFPAPDTDPVADTAGADLGPRLSRPARTLVLDSVRAHCRGIPLPPNTSSVERRSGILRSRMNKMGISSRHNGIAPWRDGSIGRTTTATARRQINLSYYLTIPYDQQPNCSPESTIRTASRQQPWAHRSRANPDGVDSGRWPTTISSPRLGEHSSDNQTDGERPRTGKVPGSPVATSPQCWDRCLAEQRD